MTDQNNAAQAAEHDPLSDDYINHLIRQHGYDSPETVIARLWQWIGLNGGENSVTLLIYEAHKALSKLRAEGVQAGDERAAFEDAWRKLNSPIPMNTRRHDDGRYATPDIEREWRLWQVRAALASAPVADAQSMSGTVCGYTPGMSQVEIQLPRGTKLSGWLELGSKVHLSTEPAASAHVAKPSPASQDFAQEVWAAAQSPHGEPVEKSVSRVASLLAEFTAPVAGGAQPAASTEHYDEVKATLQGAHRIMESLSAIERRVGPIGSHARGYTHKITAALRHLDALYAALQASEAVRNTQADKDGGDCAKRAEVSEAQCVAVYDELNAFGQDVDTYEFGLPYLGIGDRKQKVVAIIRAALAPTQPTEQGERDGSQ